MRVVADAARGPIARSKAALAAAGILLLAGSGAPPAHGAPERAPTAVRGAAEPHPGAPPPREEPPLWQRPGRWARLRVGMSQLDVLRLLGEPGKITRYYAFERWEYPDALGRRLNFDARGRLLVWGPLAR